MLAATPRMSPFYRVLEAKPFLMVMTANSNAPIHSRLWCCLEAFCALDFEVEVTLAGDPLWLVRMEDRDRAQHAITRAAEAEINLQSFGADGARGQLQVLQAKANLHAAFEDIAISTADANCYSNKDRAVIMQLIGGRTDEVDAMIKKQMTIKAEDAVKKEVHRMATM